MNIKINFTSYGHRKCLWCSTILIILFLTFGSMMTYPSCAEAFNSSLTALDQDPIYNRIPLILIHGHNGKPAYWDNFVNYFFKSNNSLTKKYKLYKFDYDSNEVDVNSIALNLRYAINDQQELNTNSAGDPMSRKLVILAHSMGGLVARSYMQEQGASERIIKIITLATPHHGSPAANDAPRVNALSDSIWEVCLKFIDNSTDVWCTGETNDIGICISGYIGVDAPNRKDMLWDSYDSPNGATGYNSCPECNPWLRNLNAHSGDYNHKLILYYGWLDRNNSTLYDSLSAADMGPAELSVFLTVFHDHHDQLAGTAVILHHVYSEPNDGLVPWDSASFSDGN